MMRPHSALHAARARGPLVAALTYMYVLATGLAFYSPHLYWIARDAGRRRRRRASGIRGSGLALSSRWLWMCARGAPTCGSPPPTALGRADPHYIRQRG